jgi:hypothetical protein
LDKDLHDALNPVQKRLWTDFSPSGLVAIDYTLSRDPQTSETYTLNVELLDVEGKYTEFPYPLKNVTGHLFFDQNSIDVRDFVSQVDDRKIVATGKITATDTNEPDFNILIEVAYTTNSRQTVWLMARLEFTHNRTLSHVGPLWPTWISKTLP